MRLGHADRGVAGGRAIWPEPLATEDSKEV
jgi:hypothetical protein